LIVAGHQVTGMARSDAGAQGLEEAGGQVLRGEMQDFDGLRRAAAEADCVIHLAFIHFFSDCAASCEADKLAIEALGGALAGSGKPLMVSGGVSLIAPGRIATEDMDPPADSPFTRVSSRQGSPSPCKACALRWCGCRRSTIP